MRFKLATTVTAGLLVTLAACSSAPPGENAPGDDEQAAPAAEPEETVDDSDEPGEAETLRIAGIEYDYSQAAIDAFEEQHPDISVDWNPGTLAFEDGEVQTLLRSGSGPDVLIVNSGPGRVGELSKADLIAPLDELFAANGIEEQYQASVIDQTRSQGGGQVYEVVEGLDVFQVYYNTELFDTAGVEVPETWDDLLAMCPTLAESGVKPMTLGTRDNFPGGWLLGSLVQASAGRETMSEIIYEDAPFDQEEVVRGGQMLADLVDNGCLDGQEAAALDWPQSTAEFFNDSAAMTVMPQGPLVGADEGIDTSKFDSFLIPSRDDDRDAAPTAGVAHSWVVNADAAGSPAVEAWINWITSEDYLRIATEQGAELAPARNVPDDLELNPFMQEAVQILQSTDPGFNPSVYLPAEGTAAWYEAVTGILTGQTSPEDAMANVEAALAGTR